MSDDDFHKIFSIDGLEPEQAKALAALVKAAQAGELGNRSDKSTNGEFYLKLIGTIVTIIVGVCIVGMLWLFADNKATSEKINSIQTNQERVLEKLGELVKKAE